MELRQNIGVYTQAGVTMGALKLLTDYIVYSTPAYAVVQTLGRYGKGVFDVALGLALDFADRYAPQIDTFRLPSRLYMVGLVELIQAFADQLQGKGHAHITRDGLVKTDPEDTIKEIYKQKGDVVKEAQTGSVSGGIGMVHYVAVGEKRVYSFTSPYELPDA